jgi:hypothetical protein
LIDTGRDLSKNPFFITKTGKKITADWRSPVMSLKSFKRNLITFIVFGVAIFFIVSYDLWEDLFGIKHR